MSIRDFFKPKVLTPASEQVPLSAPAALDQPPKKPVAAAVAPTSSGSSSKRSSPIKASGKKSRSFAIADLEEDGEDVDKILKQMPDTLAAKGKGLPQDKPCNEEDDRVGEDSKKKPASTGTTASQAKKAKTSEAQPAGEATPKKQFNYHAYMAKKSAAPAALGSKEIPTGAPNCLEGLAFVFTGDLTSIGRDDATDLVKRYGGRVTTAPSGKTDFVVVGDAPGESKMEKVNKLGLKTLDEDGFLNLIREQSAKLGYTPQSEAKAKDANVPAVAAPVSQPIEAKKPVTSVPPPSLGSDDRLWTVKYAPGEAKDLIGNHSVYEKLMAWIQSWNGNTPPQDFRAALLSGPPGIGKTSMAHMVCKAAGYDVVELNASDTRSKKTLHDEVREVINNSSLAGFFAPKAAEAASKVRKQAIIMDECDGMSAGDRGGMAELIQLIKKTRVPIICVCNDRASPKVRSLANYCLDLRFRRPDARQVVPRITEICKREGINLSANAIEELVASTQADIRQIINLLSTFRLTATDLTYDVSKRLGELNKKDIEEGPFDAIHQLLSGQGFSRMSMNQKIDLYFIDNSLMPLMMQENYLKSRGSTPRTVYDPKYGASSANFMTLAWAAADSISSADGVDNLIRGYNQEWSLAPLHAVYSTVRPAYFCSGNLSGRIDFAGWLGQNSKAAKYSRLAKEISQHLYIHTMANRLTTCLDYAPVMAAVMVSHLRSTDTSLGIENAIKFMDAYSLAKEDVEPLFELVMDPNCNSQAYTKLPTATKSAFTRKYNQGTHMLPYSLGSAVPVRRVRSDVAAGQDEAGDEDETMLEPNEAESAEDGNDSNDLSKDKMIKAKPAAGPKGKAVKKK